MTTTYIIRKVPDDVHARLSLEAEARGISIPNLLRQIIGESLEIDWPAKVRGNRGANKGKKINQPKGKQRKPKPDPKEEIQDDAVRR